jgi:colanic acid biosynthesis protein WcaH
MMSTSAADLSLGGVVIGERLNDIEFAQVVRSTPLISVDLIIRDPDGKVLVGLRTNEPARGFYFVPGGIILKNETIAAAFARILHSELGCQVSFEKARFVGIFEHFYSANRFGNPEFGTHYIALAYEVLLTWRSFWIPSIAPSDGSMSLNCTTR